MKAHLVVVVRRTAQVISLLIDGIRILLLLPFMALGLMVCPQVFHRQFYRSAPEAGWFQRRLPKLHFLLIGVWQLRDPHPRFSQVSMVRDFPRLRLANPVLNHVLNPRAEEEFPLRDTELATAVSDVLSPIEPVAVFVPEPAAADVAERFAVEPAPAPASVNVISRDNSAAGWSPTFDEVWTLIKSDVADLCTEVSSLTPTEQLRRTLRDVVQVGPPHSEEMDAVVRLMQRMPDRVDHLFIVPWLGIKGGAERLAERFLAVLRAFYPADRLCIFIPDAIHSYSEGPETQYGIPIVAINDELPDATVETRIQILDRILVNLRPGCVHNASSYVAWTALVRHAHRYRWDMDIFVSIFSDIRIGDGVPVGYYHNHLPFLIDHVAGVLCDNRRIIDHAVRDFGLTDELADKFFCIPTPLLGLNGGDPRLALRPFSLQRSRRSLWMSRIAVEKRIDVLNAIARAMPDRQIAVYGATLAVSAKVDLSLLDLPNIDLKGEFDRLSRLPIQEFDSYIFTSNCEGMPIAVLEATMMGLPVIAPDVGGIAELIDASTGWLVSSPDAVDEYVAALAEIEANPDEVARRVARAQARLVEYHSLGSFLHALKRVPGYLQERR